MNYLPEKGYKRVIVLSFYTLLIIISFYIFFEYVIKLIYPFIFAWLIAFILFPLVKKISKASRIPQKIIGVLLVTALLLLAGTLMFFILNRIYTEIREIVFELSDSSAITDTIYGFISSLSDKLPIIDAFGDGDYLMTVVSDMISSAMSSLSSKLPEYLTSIISALPGIIFSSTVMIIASYYICSDYQEINSFISAQLPDKIVSFIRLAKDNIAKTGSGYIRAYLVIILVTFAQLLTGFTILRINYAFTIAVVVAFVDILPIIGVGTVLIPWSVILFLNGDRFTAIGLIIIFIIVSIVRQFVEPRIIGISLGLHPLVTLISMYAGLKLFGFIGIIILPLTVIILKKLNDSGTVHLWKYKKRV